MNPIIDYQGGQGGHRKVCLEYKLAAKEKKGIKYLNPECRLQYVQLVICTPKQPICSAHVVSALVCMFITQIVHLCEKK